LLLFCLFILAGPLLFWKIGAVSAPKFTFGLALIFRLLSGLGFRGETDKRVREPEISRIFLSVGVLGGGVIGGEGLRDGGALKFDGHLKFEDGRD
jgi:hypothetical protein